MTLTFAWASCLSCSFLWLRWYPVTTLLRRVLMSEPRGKGSLPFSPSASTKHRVKPSTKRQHQIGPYVPAFRAHKRRSYVERIRSPSLPHAVLASFSISMANYSSSYRGTHMRRLIPAESSPCCCCGSLGLVDAMELGVPGRSLSKSSSSRSSTTALVCLLRPLPLPREGVPSPSTSSSLLKNHPDIIKCGETEKAETEPNTHLSSLSFCSAARALLSGGPHLVKKHKLGSDRMQLYFS